MIGNHDKFLDAAGWMRHYSRDEPETRSDIQSIFDSSSLKSCAINDIVKFLVIIGGSTNYFEFAVIFFGIHVFALL